MRILSFRLLGLVAGGVSGILLYYLGWEALLIVLGCAAGGYLVGFAAESRREVARVARRWVDRALGR
jgi:hypothetical protein